MKRIILLFVALFAFAVSAQAQTFEYFFKPRPSPVHDTISGFQAKDGAIQLALPAGVDYEFKPTFSLAVTQVRPGINGGETDATFLNAMGPALTFQKTSFDDNGNNYADWSANVALLLSGTTDESPVFTPQVAVLGAVLNNILSFGVSYDINSRTDGRSRFGFLVGVQLNLTNN
jgi:hypothetical protein